MLRVVAMILAGGRVDELRQLTRYRPKSAVPFAGFYRIIDFSLSNLMHSRIATVGVLSQYRSSPLINHILDGSSWDLSGRKRSLKLLPPFRGEKESDWYDGTVDAVNQNLNFILRANPHVVLILSGDHIYSMNYQNIIKYHTSKDADLTIGFKPISREESRRFGVAELDDEDGNSGGRVVSYYEKPTREQCEWASMTVYVFRTEFLLSCLKETIPLRKTRESVEFGRELIPALVNRIKNKSKIYGYKFHGYWGYTKTVSEYWKSNMDILYGRDGIDLEKWQVRTNLNHREIDRRAPTLLKKESSVQNSMISRGCEVYGRVVNSVLSPGVIIQKNSEVYNSIVMFDSKVGSNTFLNNAILDVDVTIDDDVQVGNQSNLDPNPDELSVISEGEKRD